MIPVRLIYGSADLDWRFVPTALLCAMLLGFATAAWWHLRRRVRDWHDASPTLVPTSHRACAVDCTPLVVAIAATLGAVLPRLRACAMRLEASAALAELWAVEGEARSLIAHVGMPTDYAAELDSPRLLVDRVLAVIAELSARARTDKAVHAVLESTVATLLGALAPATRHL